MTDTLTPQICVRLLLVDDHAIIRSGLANMLNTLPEFEVVGEASGGVIALEMHEALKPDVTILDVVMPNMNGIECLQQIKQRDPDAHVLMLSSSEKGYDISSAVKGGADGYVAKSALPAELTAAILAVNGGESFFSESVSNRLAEYAGASHLTPRELEVLRLLREGMSNPDIGLELGISARTAKAHVAAILLKLAARDRTQAVARGFERGLLR